MIHMKCSVGIRVKFPNEFDAEYRYHRLTLVWKEVVAMP